jgi:hypothetical protein
LPDRLFVVELANTEDRTSALRTELPEGGLRPSTDRHDVPAGTTPSPVT